MIQIEKDLHSWQNYCLSPCQMRPPRRDGFRIWAIQERDRDGSGRRVGQEGDLMRGLLNLSVRKEPANPGIHPGGQAMTKKVLITLLLLLTCALSWAAPAEFPLQQDRAGASGEWVTDLAPFDPALPLPPLRLVAEGLPDGTTVEVARDDDSPFLPVVLRDGRGRLPLAVPDVEALRRLRVRSRTTMPARSSSSPRRISP